MEGYIDPSGIGRKAIGAFSDEVMAYLSATIRSLPSEPARSAELTKQIIKRVPPSALKNYDSVIAAARLFEMEVADIGNRAANYQNIERYRYFFSTPDKDMHLSFLDHTYSLRSSELYVILERGSELLKFGAVLAENVGLDGVDNHRKFMAAFKKQFERRLRERHRMVHAHERPSLVSRLLALQDWSDPQVQITLRNFAGKIMGLLKELQKDAPEVGMPIEDRDTFRVGYLKAVDAEASAMWELIERFVRECLGDIPKAT